MTLPTNAADGATEPTKVPRGPSPIFLGLLVIAGAAGWALWSGIGDAGIVAFVFILTAWVITLSLHEFSHALVAFRNGDVSVVHRGYLTLDPLRYTHVVFSLVMPLVFLLLGGIGLPGGAVFIDRRAIKSRAAMSAVSAAGPLANLAIALALAFAITVGFRTGPYEFWAALAFLLFLQVTATVLNLLPVPGLDGFGVIEPYLPKAVLAQAAKVAPFAILGLFALLWIPAVNSAFFGAILTGINALGVPGILIGSGYNLFQFWR